MRVLVLLDLAGANAELLQATVEIAGPARGEVTLLNVACPDADFEGDELRQDVSRAGIAAELRRRHRQLHDAGALLQARGLEARPLMVRCASVRGNPNSKLLEEIERLRPDLVVVGSRCRGALYRLIIGSTTDTIIRHARCPVLLVPCTSRGIRPAAPGGESSATHRPTACRPAGAK